MPGCWGQVRLLAGASCSSTSCGGAATLRVGDVATLALLGLRRENRSSVSVSVFIARGGLRCLSLDWVVVSMLCSEALRELSLLRLAMTMTNLEQTAAVLRWQRKLNRSNTAPGSRQRGPARPAGQAHPRREGPRGGWRAAESFRSNYR